MRHVCPGSFHITARQPAWKMSVSRTSCSVSLISDGFWGRGPEIRGCCLKSRTGTGLHRRESGPPDEAGGIRSIQIRMLHVLRTETNPVMVLETSVDGTSDGEPIRLFVGQCRNSRSSQGGKMRHSIPRCFRPVDGVWQARAFRAKKRGCLPSSHRILVPAFPGDYWGRVRADGAQMAHGTGRYFLRPGWSRQEPGCGR